MKSVASKIAANQTINNILRPCKRTPVFSFFGRRAPSFRADRALRPARNLRQTERRIRCALWRRTKLHLRSKRPSTVRQNKIGPGRAPSNKSERFCRTPQSERHAEERGDRRPQLASTAPCRSRLDSVPSTRLLCLF